MLSTNSYLKLKSILLHQNTYLSCDVHLQEQSSQAYETHNYHGQLQQQSCILNTQGIYIRALYTYYLLHNNFLRNRAYQISNHQKTLNDKYQKRKRHLTYLCVLKCFRTWRITSPCRYGVPTPYLSYKFMPTNVPSNLRRGPPMPA